MNNVERFKAVMSFQYFDRLPRFEWAEYWNKTIERWHGEGLPANLMNYPQISGYFGLDAYEHLWIEPRHAKFPVSDNFSIKNRNDYQQIKKYLYPDLSEEVRLLIQKCRFGETVFWVTLEGFFWFPRTLFGIEYHLYAFYDEPELMHEINNDLVDYHLRTLEHIRDYCKPEFVTIAEDMSYNIGPMISKECFDEFMAPYYRRIIPAVKQLGSIPFVDSDGDVNILIAWLENVGVEGILPLERASGVDIQKIRKKHPQFRMIGAFDKRVMKDGETAMRAEFDRLLPIMRQGGFIPSVDHQTPPDVSLHNYQCYVSLLKEYCQKAAC